MTERTCHECGEKFARRKKGCCPHCGAEVIAYDTEWVTELPTQKILKTFETLIREHQKRQGFDGFLFRIPRSSLGKETTAAMLILEEADGNVDLVVQTMLYLKAHRKHSSYFLGAASLWQVRSMIGRYLALVNNINKQAEQRQAQQEKEMKQLEDRYGELF